MTHDKRRGPISDARREKTFKHPLATDADVMRAVSLVARDLTPGREIKAKTFFGTSEADLAQGLSNRDIESSPAGQLARIKRLEYLVSKQGKEMAALKRVWEGKRK
jgi:hypothetical protein